LTVDEELARKIQEEDQARAITEQEQERLNFEAALEIQRQLDERQRVAAEPTIDWNDPSVLRYHSLKNKPVSIAQARKNMITYLVNQGRYKHKYFKKMSYDDIRPIFEKVRDQNQIFVPMRSEIEKESSTPVEEQKGEKEQILKEVSKKSGGTRRKSLARKRTKETQDKETSKKQKLDVEKAADYEKEKEELKVYLDIVPRDEVVMDVESLATKYPIVDWETHVLSENLMYYKIIKGDNSSKNYKILSEMLDDFDRQDVEDLHKLVKEKYKSTKPEGYDLILWEDLKVLFKPNEDDEIWKNQQEYNLISWRLCDACGIHILLMNTGMAIHMMIYKITSSEEVKCLKESSAVQTRTLNSRN
ncbi:hypothetical protein Tco_0185752, partial [Tanacetum coccineum]